MLETPWRSMPVWLVTSPARRPSTRWIESASRTSMPGRVSPATCAAMPPEASAAGSPPPRTIRLAPRRIAPTATRPAPTRDCRILAETITLRQSSIPAVPWVVGGLSTSSGGKKSSTGACAE